MAETSCIIQLLLRESSLKATTDCYPCVSLVVSCMLVLCECTSHSLTLCVSVYAVQRRAIVTVLDAHRQDLDTTSLTSDLKGMGILTEEQCQKLASLDDERRHEALLYTLLAHDGPDTYDKLVECMELRDTSIAADLQGVLVYQVLSNVVTKLQIV